MKVAEINIARMKAPLDSATMQEFRDFIDPINALAESSPGFVWRMTDGADEQESNIESPFGDQMIIINLSVWESLEQLQEFTYKTVHSYFVRSRKRWFNGLEHPAVAIWHVADGEIPTVAEAKAKPELLEHEGPSARVFTFATWRAFSS